MKSISAIARSLVLLSLLATASAEAAVIFTTTGSVTAANPTQTGRLSRNAIAQTWDNDEPFPGVINTTTSYHYTTYAINVGITPFIQIEFDSVSANTFISAYQTSYLPDSAGTPNFGFDTHWLGDAGSTGNFFGVDTVFFQVTAALNSTIIIVVNQTAAGAAGLGDPFGIEVEGFIDNAFTDPPAVTVPEPSTVMLGLAALLGIAAFRFRRPSNARMPTLAV